MSSSDPERDSLLESMNKNKTQNLLCDPRRWLHRYTLLIFMCFMSFGSYFCYDSPGSLQDVMKRDLEIDTSQFTLFYSLYSWPNVILCFFGGFLLDKYFGLCWGTIIFSSITTLGQIIFASGAFFKSLGFMYLGRFIFGLGGESLGVAQNTYAVSWFEGKALNMIFGLQLSLARLGSTVGMISNSKIYSTMEKIIPGYQGLGVTLYIASIFCFYSLFNSMVMGFFHQRAQRILNRDVNQGSDETGSESLTIKDIKNFGGSFWFLCCICVSYYVAIFPFISLALVFYESKYMMSPTEAGLVNSLIYILAAIFSPISGFAIDRIGKNIFWILIGVIFSLAGHALLTFTFITPYIPGIMMGFAYSILASALWPLVAMVMPRKQIGTAYGIMQSIQNLGLALATYIGGVLVDYKGFFMLEIFFILCLCIALLFVVFLFFIDIKNDGILNLSSKERKRRKENIIEEIAN